MFQLLFCFEALFFSFFFLILHGEYVNTALFWLSSYYDITDFGNGDDISNYFQLFVQLFLCVCECGRLQLQPTCGFHHNLLISFDFLKFDNGGMGNPHPRALQPEIATLAEMYEFNTTKHIFFRNKEFIRK